MGLGFQKTLDYVKQIISTNPILIYPDPYKQCCLFMDSIKLSCNGIIIQYTEQIKEDRTKLKMLHPVTYQSDPFQGSQKN